MTPRLLKALEPLFELVKEKPVKRIPDAMFYYAAPKDDPTGVLVEIPEDAKQLMQERGLDLGDAQISIVRSLLASRGATAYLLVQEAWKTEHKTRESAENALMPSQDPNRVEVLVCSGQDGAEVFVRSYPIIRNADGDICGFGEAMIPEKIAGRFIGLLNPKPDGPTVSVTPGLDVSRN